MQRRDKAYISVLAAYGEDFGARRRALRAEARDKVAEILSRLPGGELVSDSALGWLLYETMGGEWAEAAIHGLHIDKHGVTVTCEPDYGDDGKPRVNDWGDEDRAMTFHESDHYANINWPLTLEQVISEIECNPEIEFTCEGE